MFWSFHTFNLWSDTPAHKTFWGERILQYSLQNTFLSDRQFFQIFWYQTNTQRDQSSDQITSTLCWRWQVISPEKHNHDIDFKFVKCLQRKHFKTTCQQTVLLSDLLHNFWTFHNNHAGIKWELYKALTASPITL